MSKAEADGEEEASAGSLCLFVSNPTIIIR